jgi:hypothetical protein
MAQFQKATGVAMIQAHRLLKNDVPSHEYILATDHYLQHFADRSSSSGYLWTRSSANYESLGDITFEYAQFE